MERPPISVVIPALNAEARLAACLDALVPAAVERLVREVVLVDGGSEDATREIADGFGATVLTASPGRGGQLKAGAEAARGEWFLFLHADTVLEDGWAQEVSELIRNGIYDAGVFRLRFDAAGLAPRVVAFGANWRTRLARAPYGDQGLLISRAAYEAIGGYANAPLFEDVDIIDRLLRTRGANSLNLFRAAAVTSADRYERDGYVNRVVKNFILFARYRFGAAPEDLAKAYR